MAAPILKATLRAAKLLDTPHPKHLGRTYTVAEAAKKTGINRSTLYRHIKSKPQGETT